jgi:hypothetical protein
MRLFEFIWGDGGATFIKNFKLGASYESLGTTALDGDGW